MKGSAVLLSEWWGSGLPPHSSRLIAHYSRLIAHCSRKLPAQNPLSLRGEHRFGGHGGRCDNRSGTYRKQEVRGAIAAPRTCIARNRLHHPSPSSPPHPPHFFPLFSLHPSPFILLFSIPRFLPPFILHTSHFILLVSFLCFLPMRRCPPWTGAAGTAWP